VLPCLHLTASLDLLAVMLNVPFAQPNYTAGMRMHSNDRRRCHVGVQHAAPAEQHPGGPKGVACYAPTREWDADVKCPFSMHGSITSEASVQ